MSGYEMWKQAGKKAAGSKQWAARTLSKQAWKCRNHLIEKWRIYRGDKVMITAGKDKGEVGVVKEVFRKENRMIIEGLNLVNKHVKKSRGKPGKKITMEAPVQYSNVNIVDPITGSPVRIAMKFLADGTKVRVSAGRLASGSVIPKSDIAMARRKPRSTTVGHWDTDWQEALRNTYNPAPPPEITEISYVPAPPPESAGMFGSFGR